MSAKLSPDMYYDARIHEYQVYIIMTFMYIFYEEFRLTFRLLMSYMYGAPILDVSRSHTTTQHSR